MARINEECFWYYKDYTQCTDKDWTPRHWCELRGELDAGPYHYICSQCRRFIDKEYMEEKLEIKRRREEQNKNKWEISWE